MGLTRPPVQSTNTQRWLYALSMLGVQIPAQVVNVSLLFFYTDVKRLPPQWSATALTLYAIYNAVNNPLIGYFSDRTNTRWGRRLPYLWLGTLPMMIIFGLLWRAPFNGNENPVALLIYMVVGIVLYDALANGTHRGRGATSKMRCIDVAALFAAAMLRRNPDSVVIPFGTSVYDAKMDPNDSILSIAERLVKYGGGGTDCSLPLVAANQKHAKRKFAGIILVSDNESWVGTGRHGSTGVMTAWEAFTSNQRKLNGGAASPKLVCINLQQLTTDPAHTFLDRT